MLKSKREESSFIAKSPLSDFIGTVKGYVVLDRTGKFAKAGQKVVGWQFTDVVVNASDEPYELKTAVIAINFSDSANSGYAAFEDSIAEAYDVPIEEACIDMTIGARIRVTREDNHLFFTDAKTKVESRGVVWHIAEIVGKAKKAAKAKDIALGILKDKNAADFLQAAIADPTIKKDGKLCTDIISGAFLETDDVKENFTLTDDGVYIVE